MLPNALVRNRFTETQTKKNKLRRWENVEDVFSVTNQELILNKRVALVDDVVTTGSTIEAASNVLIKSGCSEISVISLAYAGK
jgi:predicted amidophosphoribosyltransferase